MTPEDVRRDRDLAVRAASGEESAWRTIYEETSQPLFNFLCYQVGSREEARDLLQETYLVAWSNLRLYRGDGALISWLRSIALRKSLDWKRQVARRMNRLRELSRDLRGATAQPTSDARLEVGMAAFQRALGQLSSRQRASLLLRDLEDLSFREVAREIGCNETTARVHYLRARERMRKALDPAAQPSLEEGMGGQQV
ncbi:MAG: RNA polymerase sigma factor [Candidatus Krumholzibacteriia bacterium]